MRAPMALRATPSATPAIPSASNPKTGNTYSGPGCSGRSATSDAERSWGTYKSRTAMSWLPVPRRPDTVHVSITSAAAAGKSIVRTSGAPFGSRRGLSFSMSTAPPISQLQCSHPLANGQRPVTR